jgi:hypothetical protein
MKLIEMQLDEDAIANGVDAISLVQDPAIQMDFIALKSHEIKMATVSEEKRLVLGAVLIPDKPILRVDEAKQPYHIFFSQNTVRKASQLFFKRGYQNNSTLEHAIKLQGVSFVESWIVENPEMDKAKHYGMNVTAGTWMAAAKIESDQIWHEYVKTGMVKGFSIEGFFKEKIEASAIPEMKVKQKAKIKWKQG